jgi:hypothetical protein
MPINKGFYAVFICHHSMETNTSELQRKGKNWQPLATARGLRASRFAIRPNKRALRSPTRSAPGHSLPCGMAVCQFRAGPGQKDSLTCSLNPQSVRLNVDGMNANQRAGTFFEEFIRLEFDQRGVLISAQGIGSRIVDNAGGRPLGSDGLREFDLTEPIMLTRGLKKITYRASGKNPMRVHTMLQRIEGHKGLTFQNYQPAQT